VSARRGAAVFLDRDGTLIEGEGYLADPSALRLLPGVAHALARLRAGGWRLVLATNQSGVARGLLDEQRLFEIHVELERQLAREGARLDLLLHCPHHPEEGTAPYRRACSCRKPQPGMLLEAAERLELDLSRCWSIGDDERDLEAARRAGARPLLVLTGKGERTRAAQRARGLEPESAPDLERAADLILSAGFARVDAGGPSECER
jgi:D-glycero-D-manno-heptose 1,7-bisphosphate phosphatase